MKDFEFHTAWSSIWRNDEGETYYHRENWPYRLKLRPGQPGAHDKYDRCMRDSMSGKERYVEWEESPSRHAPKISLSVSVGHCQSWNTYTYR